MQPADCDSPLAPSASHLQRIRVRAYRLWESEGRPVGQSEAYWERARELDAIEHVAPLAIENPVTKHPPQTSDGVLIEDASLQENLGNSQRASRIRVTLCQLRSHARSRGNFVMVNDERYVNVLDSCR